jgi:hypothetical protein
MLIGYAEASTTPRSTFGQWLKRRWLFVSLKGLLLVVLVAIGGTIGSEFFDFSPALPYRGVIQVAAPHGDKTAATLSNLRHCHDLVSPESADSLFRNIILFSGKPPSVAEITRCVRVSPIKPDNSFSVTVVGKDEHSCGELGEACAQALWSHNRDEDLQLQIDEGGVRLTDAAERAPTIDTAVGIAMGLLLGLVIIRIAATRFRADV